MDNESKRDTTPSLSAYSPTYPNPEPARPTYHVEEEAARINQNLRSLLEDCKQRNNDLQHTMAVINQELNITAAIESRLELAIRELGLS